MEDPSNIPPASPPQPPSVGAALWIVAGTALLLWFASWGIFGGIRIHGYVWPSNVRFSRPELAFYAGVFLVQIALFPALALALARRWHVRMDRIVGGLLENPIASYAAIAIVAGLVSFLLGMHVVDFRTLTEDEKTYLFQAKLLEMGRLSIPVPPEAASFHQPFIVMRDGEWTGQYFWAHSAFLLGGMLLGSAWIATALQVAGAVFFSSLAVREYADDPRAGLLGGLLVAASPMVLLTGGTLHNANLSLMCSAAALWGIARLSRSFSWPATAVLGIAVGLGINNRPLDVAALLLAAAVILIVRERGRIDRVALRFGPAVLVTLPFLALLALSNDAVTGSFWQTGYSAFNESNGWTTMGFGTGPFGFPADMETSSAKTLAVAVRLAFYTTGSPIAFLLLLAALGAGTAGAPGRAWTPAVVAATYLFAYFLYAATSLIITGPMYFDALVPVLCGWMAAAAVRTHDRIREHPAGRRLVPALILAQGIAALVAFWPSAMGEVFEASRSSGNCALLAEALERPALVFVEPEQVVPLTWSRMPPLPSPTFDDRVLFPRVMSREQDAAVVERFGAGRDVFMGACVGDSIRLVRYDTGTGTISPLGASR